MQLSDFVQQFTHRPELRDRIRNKKIEDELMNCNKGGGVPLFPLLEALNSAINQEMKEPGSSVDAEFKNDELNEDRLAYLQTLKDVTISASP